MRTLRRRVFQWAVIFSAIFSSACTPGIIYTDYTVPLVRNMHETPRGVTLAKLRTIQIKEPLTAFNVAAQWSSRAIGDAAKQAGLEEVYYADLNTFSLLLGLYQKKTIEVWGK